eukprot:TRINITY_DN2418_c0_g1_i1.p1 TRINITY_DN2418_c0_g1~~TRINITY_DN2418_c0_g1_i1.p1  ORF type:complete len:476 (-),score=43.56 TRINITY_DN2418_c0_g1_i1:178-1605(-)
MKCLAGMSFARWRMFWIVYLAYAAYYLPRKALTIAKPFLESEVGLTRVELGWLDTAYLVSYTVSMLFSGTLGNYVPANVCLFIGLTGCAVCNLFMSMCTSPHSFMAVCLLHGISQSFGWPTCIKLMSVWLPDPRHGNRGTLMGFWTTCQSVGGIIGTVLATYLANAFGWQASFLHEVVLLLVVGFAMLAFVSNRPTAEALAEQDTELASENGGKTMTAMNANGKGEPKPEQPRLSLLQVIRIDSVRSIACAYFFLKFIRYALLMWLPYYFHGRLGYSSTLSGYISTSFEVGGMIGTPLIGIVSDRLFRGRLDLTSCIFMAASSVMVALCSIFAEAGVAFNFVCMTIIGVLIIGPDSVLSGSIAQDVAHRAGCGPAVVGTLASFLNSAGSTGAIFQGVLTAHITRNYGWEALFALFVACCATCAAILGKVSLDGNRSSSRQSGVAQAETPMRREALPSRRRRCLTVSSSVKVEKDL